MSDVTVISQITAFLSELSNDFLIALIARLITLIVR